MRDEQALTEARTMWAGKAVQDTTIDRRMRATTETSAREAAFRQMADAQLHESYRIANAILGSSVEAEDAVHDAIVTAWQSWSTLRDQTKFAPWFTRIVINTCRNRLKRGARRKTTDIAEQSGLATPDASQHVHDRDQLERALMRLKPDDRILLALRYYRDLPLDDIAELLDVPLGTVKSRLNRAHGRLRDVITRSSLEGPTR